MPGPGLSNDGLEIADGNDAPVTFAKMSQGMAAVDETERKRVALLECYEWGTLALTKLVLPKPHF